MSSFINFKNCGYTPHPESHGSKSIVISSEHSGLIQQSSINTITFDEVQNTMGGNAKAFGSMNMDELIRNIWASEETETMAPNSDLSVVNNVNLQEQGSLTVPRPLSQKTADEVWRELVKENSGFEDVNLIKEPTLQPVEKQPALGEVTLEAFLQKAGVVSENGQTQINEKRLGSSQQSKPQKILPKLGAINFTSSLNLMAKAQMGSSVNGVSMAKAQMGSSVNGVSIYERNDNHINLVNEPPSPPTYAYGEGVVCVRKMDGSLEKVVERRRKRMIKNRESAARSRARKQAYTLELEAEVAKLKKLNHELQKKQEETMESQSFQVPEKMKKKLCLRRTLTGPW